MRVSPCEVHSGMFQDCLDRPQVPQRGLREPWVPTRRSGWRAPPGRPPAAGSCLCPAGFPHVALWSFLLKADRLPRPPPVSRSWSQGPSPWGAGSKFRSSDAESVLGWCLLTARGCSLSVP